MSKLTTVLLTVGLTLSLTANGLMYLRYSSSRPIVRMDGAAVTRKEYRDALDSAYGKPILTRLVLSKIILSKAQELRCMPTSKDIEDRIALVERRKPSLLGQDADPLQAAQLRSDVRTDLALENLRIRDIRVSDADVQAAYRQNIIAFTTPMKVEATTVVTQDAMDAQTAAEYLRQGLMPDEIARQPRMAVAGVHGFEPDISNLPPATARNLQQTMEAMHPGDIRTVQVGNAYYTFTLRNRSEAGTLPLSAVRPQAERLAKLARAESNQAILAQIYHDAHPTFEDNRFASYFDDLNNQPLQPEVKQSMAPVNAGTNVPQKI